MMDATSWSALAPHGRGGGVGAGAVNHEFSIAGGSFDGLGGEGVYGELSLGYDYMLTDRFLLGGFISARMGMVETTLSIPTVADTTATLDHGFDAVARAGMNIINNQPYARMLGFPTSPTAAADVLSGAWSALSRRMGRRPFHAIQSFSRFMQAPYQTVGPSTDLAALERQMRCPLRGLAVIAAVYRQLYA
mgnify:CR=1 FL=1